MYYLCYNIAAVSPDMPDDMLEALNAATVTGLALVNRVILDYYNLPPLYQMGMRYHVPKEVESGRSREQWKDIATLLKDRWGDCKDFTAWRLAELWKAGKQAYAESRVYREGKSLLFHTYIRFPDGSTEDPARTLGMP
jgi:hypothetical protein